MPRVYSRMLMCISLKRWALIEEIYNTSSEAQVIVATVFVKSGHELASSRCLFVSVSQLTVCLSEDDSKISQIRISVPNLSYFCLSWAKGCFCSPLYHVCSCIYSCPSIWKAGNIKALCWSNVFLINLHGDTRFNSNWFSDCVHDWVVYYL